MKDKILLVGGSGYMGSELRKVFPDADYTTRHSENTDPHAIYWDYKIPFPSFNYTVVINLLGHPITDLFFHKKEIYETRVTSTKNLLNSFPKLKQYVCISAIGIYQKGSFLHTVLTDIEDIANKHTCNVATLRLAPVVSKSCPLQKAPILPLLKNEKCAWVHVDDVVSAIKYVVDEKLGGTFDVVNPKAVSWKTVAKRLQIPYLVIPNFLAFTRGPYNALFSHKSFGKNPFVYKNDFF